MTNVVDEKKYWQANRLGIELKIYQSTDDKTNYILSQVG